MGENDGAAGYVSPGDDKDKPTTREEALQGQAARAFAAQFGIELDPTKGEITDVIDYLFDQWEGIQNLPSWGLFGVGRDIAEQMFWMGADEMLAPYKGFGAPKPEEAERAGDPLNLYFQAVDRMMDEMTGPYPEARYFGAEGYRESFETLTPSSFDEYLQEQEPNLRGEFMSELFLEKQARMEQFGALLAGLPEEQRYTRMLQLSREAGLDAMPSYETFLAEKRPLLEQKYRYLNPLGDEPQRAWREAFPEEFGPGAVGTEFSKFLGMQQEGLLQQYEDVARAELRRGTGAQGVPDLTTWLQEQRGGMETQYRFFKPLGEEPQAEWASAFPDLFGEGAQETPFSQYLGRQQEGLSQQYEDLVRGQLREGTALGDLPDLETWFAEQRPDVERSFALSGPQYTGRSPTGIFRPKKRIM